MNAIALQEPGSKLKGPVTDCALPGKTFIWLPFAGGISAFAVILPKLFRRLTEYFADNAGELSLSGFKQFVRAHGDRMVIISTGHSTGFDYVVSVQGQTVKLTSPPEDLMFIEA